MGLQRSTPGLVATTRVEYPSPHRELVVVGADEAPHVAPVWVDLDGDDIAFTTGADALKGTRSCAIRECLCFGMMGDHRSALLP